MSAWVLWYVSKVAADRKQVIYMYTAADTHKRTTMY